MDSSRRTTGCSSTSDRDAFAAAVRAYELERVELDPAPLELARATLDEARLLLVGEGHGRRETPSVLWTLAHELDARGLALEWSHDELGEFVRDLDLERLWSLPPTAEAFCGDGRFTAGHVALLRRLREERRLEQLILFDRLDPEPNPDWRPRDGDMAQRLLDEWNGRTRLIAVAGAFHARLDVEAGETMAMHLSERLPLRPAMLQHDGSPPMPPAPIVFRLPPATPAELPRR
jgi:hypothetical protein